MKVKLADGTVGEVDYAKVGQYVTVESEEEDAFGFPIEVSGEVVEILEG
jgi:hypothetical protein